MSNAEETNKNKVFLKLPKILEDLNVEFYIDKNDDYVKFRCNTEYIPSVNLDVPISIIGKGDDGWIKFTNRFNVKKTYPSFKQEHNTAVQSAITNNGSLIRNYIPKNDTNGNKQNTQQPEEPTITTSNLSFAEWSIQLIEKYKDLQKEIKDLIPELWEPTEFALSVRTILRINAITLPFAGVLLGPSGGLKTATVSLYRSTKDVIYCDSFTAKSFQSHSSAKKKEELEKDDLLPMIRNKILLTPELSGIFSKREDELNEVLGVWTRILDGQGYESHTGAQGHRAYIGKYMFTWIGAAVDIPNRVHRLLGTLGPKLYFFRMKTVKKDENYYLTQLKEEKIKGDYNQKVKKIQLKMNDYLQFFDVRPFDYETVINDNNDFVDDNVLLLIVRLAMLLGHLRANVPMYESKDGQRDYEYTSISPEESYRAITHLKHLARAHALTQGRDRVTLQDIPLLIKVVLSTASKDRVILFDHLLKNNGLLYTSEIKDSMLISKKTALKTMESFVFLQLVERTDTQNTTFNPNDRKPFQIRLLDEFKWFLTDEFKKLRENFGEEYHDEYLASKQQQKEEEGE